MLGTPKITTRKYVIKSGFCPCYLVLHVKLLGIVTKCLALLLCISEAGTPVSYSSGSGFKPRLEDWPYWLRFFIAFLNLSVKNAGVPLSFLPHHFYVIVL
jgi:hypothetical protein